MAFQISLIILFDNSYSIITAMSRITKKLYSVKRSRVRWKINKR